MEVQRVIEALSKLNPTEEIMVEWFEKSHIEANHGVEYTDEHWSMAVALFDKSSGGGDDDLGIRDVMEDAADRLGDS